MIFTNERRRRGTVLVTPAIQMTAAASGSSGIVVADSDEYDLGANDFALPVNFSYQQGIADAKAEENLLLRSQEIGTSPWTTNRVTITANSGTAPDGTSTADTITGNGTIGAFWVQQVVAPGAVTTTTSFYVKQGTHSYFQISYAGDATSYANFDVTTGAGALGTSAGTVTSSIVDAGNGWYRCIAVNTSTAVTSVYGGLVPAASSTRQVGTSISTGLLVWGAQIEARSFVTAYTPTTTQVVSNLVYWLYFKYQDGNNYWGYRINSDASLAFVAAVNGLVKINVQSTGALTASQGKIIEGVFTCERESSGAAGAGNFYVNNSQLGTSVAITAASPVDISNTGSLYINGTNAVRNISDTVRAILLNFAPTAAEVLGLCTNGIPESWKWGSQAPYYLQNTSAGADSWSGASITVAGNVDSIGGRDNVLSATCTSTGTADTPRITRSLVIPPAGKKASLTFSLYRPAANTAVVGFRVTDSAGAGIFSGSVNNIITTSADAWQTFTVSGTVVSTATQTIRLYPINAAGIRQQVTGEALYLDATTSIQQGATMALLPNSIPTSGATAWDDSSGNTGGGTLPAAGATKVTIRK